MNNTGYILGESSGLISQPDSYERTRTTYNNTLLKNCIYHIADCVHSAYINRKDSRIMEDNWDILASEKKIWNLDVKDKDYFIKLGKYEKEKDAKEVEAINNMIKISKRYSRIHSEERRNRISSEKTYLSGKRNENMLMPNETVTLEEALEEIEYNYTLRIFNHITRYIDSRSCRKKN